jgi:signal transduction histidine kinase
MSNANLVHELKNQLGIILGFAEILVAETDDHDPRRADLIEIQKAAQKAVSLLPNLGGTFPSM